MSVMAARLKTVFDLLGLNANSFSVKHGEGKISRATLYNVLNPSKAPNSDSLRTICELEPAISAEYLLRGIGDPLKPDYAIGDPDPCAEYKDQIAQIRDITNQAL